MRKLPNTFIKMEAKLFISMVLSPNTPNAQFRHNFSTSKLMTILKKHSLIILEVSRSTMVQQLMTPYSILKPNTCGTPITLCQRWISYAIYIGPDEIHHFKGITSPYVYYGLPGTSFAIHIEDMALWSCNFNCGPGVKLWYVVPPSHYQILKEKLESVLEIDTCQHPLQHKNIFVDPRFFQAHDIPYTRVSCYSLHIIKLIKST